MSSPDNSECSAPLSNYAPQWTGRSHRQGSPDSVKGEEPLSARDLGILRRSVDPEIVDSRQPMPRRLGRLAASAGFIIAGVLGVIIGLLITGALRNIGGDAIIQKRQTKRAYLPVVLRSRRRPRSQRN